MARSNIQWGLLLLNMIETLNANVFWTFEPEVIRIGETLSLVCTVADVDIIDQGLIRQWTKGPELICYNGHPIDPIKYSEIVTNDNQFKLQINNVTESDLQCNYQCRYSFETQTKKIEISRHNFEYPPANETKAIIKSNVSDGSMTVDLHLKKVYPMPICNVTVGDSQMSLDIVKHHTNGIYYEVYMIKRLANSIKCNRDFEVSCQLIKNYSLAVEHINPCKPEAFTDDSETGNELLVSLLTVFIVLIVVIGFLIFKKRLKRRDSDQEEKNEKDTNNDVESQPCTCTSSSNVSDDSKSTTDVNFKEKEKFLSQDSGLGVEDEQQKIF
ncbi:uncharacterized protein LOC127717945 [Mytilus californianus]|uniref:uncharacterized protein LOC127717945 n=1 Tax=Mytilus californianus TaxID=6549 RepID=UPI0022477634|nr:uncharacterized protein LOC127717945 [Mytilus californianus]